MYEDLKQRSKEVARHWIRLAIVDPSEWQCMTMLKDLSTYAEKLRTEGSLCWSIAGKVLSHPSLQMPGARSSWFELIGKYWHFSSGLSFTLETKQRVAVVLGQCGRLLLSKVLSETLHVGRSWRIFSGRRKPVLWFDRFGWCDEQQIIWLLRNAKRALTQALVLNPHHHCLLGCKEYQNQQHWKTFRTKFGRHSTCVGHTSKWTCTRQAWLKKRLKRSTMH